jgi:predicted nucleic acid-binding protein
MTLVDSSVWVDHLRNGSARLRALLEAGEVLIHPFVIGELACGNLVRRREVLALLEALPHATEATHAEAIELLDRRRLHARGLGWVDVHLLASALVSNCRLWTLDVRLARAADGA